MATLKRCRRQSVRSETLETPRKKRFGVGPGQLTYNVIPVENKPEKHNKLEEVVQREQAKQAKNQEDAGSSSALPRKILSVTRASETRKKKFFTQFSQGELLGSGSFGQVYAGIRLRDQLPVAIKYVSKNTCKMVKEGPYHKTPAEIYFQRNLRHPNIIRLLEHHYFDKKYVLVFERPSACSDLFEYLDNYENNAISEEDGKKVFREILSAVLYLEEKCIMHNDIKTENIIVDLSNGTKVAKLTDFGLAWHLNCLPITKFTGTPEFSPPEYHIRKKYDGRQATVWSLGCFLYDMVTGSPPFKNSKHAACFPLRLPANLSQDLKDFLCVMLQKLPTKRAKLGDLVNHPWLKISA